MSNIFDELPFYNPQQEEEQWPGLHPDTARGLSSAISYAKALGLSPEVTETVRPDNSLPVGGSENSNHYARNGARAADLAWSGLQWGDANFNGIADYLESSGYKVIREPHGTGPHIHFESQDRNPIDQFLFPTASASPAKDNLFDELPDASKASSVPKQNNSIDLLDELPSASGAKNQSSVLNPTNINEALRVLNGVRGANNLTNNATKTAVDDYNASLTSMGKFRQLDGNVDETQYNKTQTSDTHPFAEFPDDNPIVKFAKNAWNMQANYNVGTLAKPNRFKDAQRINNSDYGSGWLFPDGKFVSDEDAGKEIIGYAHEVVDPIAYPLAMIPSPLQPIAAPLAGLSVVDSMRQAYGATNNNGQQEGMVGVGKAIVSPVTGLYDKISNPQKFMEELNNAPAETLFNTALELGVIASVGNGLYQWNKRRKGSIRANDEPVIGTAEEIKAQIEIPADRKTILFSLQETLDKIKEQKMEPIYEKMRDNHRADVGDTIVYATKDGNRAGTVTAIDSEGNFKIRNNPWDEQGKSTPMQGIETGEQISGTIYPKEIIGVIRKGTPDLAPDIQAGIKEAQFTKLFNQSEAPGSIQPRSFKGNQPAEIVQTSPNKVDIQIPGKNQPGSIVMPEGSSIPARSTTSIPSEYPVNANVVFARNQGNQGLTAQTQITRGKFMLDENTGKLYDVTSMLDKLKRFGRVEIPVPEKTIKGFPNHPIPDFEGVARKLAPVVGDAVAFEKTGTDIRGNTYKQASIVHPSTSEGGWQFTTFDKKGPWGHETFPTKADAIEEAFHNGYRTMVREGEVMPDGVTLYDVTSFTDKLKGLPLSRIASETWDGIRKYTAPATGDIGQYAQGLLKEVYSKQANLMHDLSGAAEQGKIIADKMDIKGRQGIIDQWESGQSHGTELDRILKPLKDFADDLAIRMVEEGHLDVKDIQSNYFSRVGLWENTPSNQKILSGQTTRIPGSPASPFLQDRAFVSAKQGRAAGMVQRDVNPITHQIDNLMQQWRFLETNKVAREMIDLGAMKRLGNDDVLLNKALSQAKKALEKYDGADKAAKQDALAMNILDGLKKKSELAGYATEIPADWIPVSDRIGKTGWYAPKDLANTFNNALSQGFSGTEFKGIANGIRETGNQLNAMQLSASAFHAGFTTVDAVVSQFALGEMKVGQGIKTGNLGMVASGVKDLAMSGIPGVNLISSGLNLRQGSKFRNEALKKGTFERQALETGGGRLGQDDWYHLGIGEKMVQAFRGNNYLGAALRLPFAVVEALPKFIMEEIVPRQKLGVYSKMVEYEMMKNPKLMENPELARKTLQKAWDSVENRMGQIAYDNLFWHKYFKDVAMLTTRSVGWNLGTVREIGGGLVDVAKSPVNVLKGKQGLESGYRASYLVALPAVVGFTGALYQYLATGKGPEELKDYFFPKNGHLDKNGAPQRVSLPSYIKDVYHYANDPAKTITNKAHPLIGMVADMLNNKDFYGTEIRHKGDPIVKQAMDSAKFALSQSLPFTVRGMAQQQDQPLSMKAQNFIGITPAPASVNNSKAEQLASEINARKMGGTQTQEQFNESQSQQRVANAFRSKNPNLNNIIKEEMSKGLITQRQLNNVFNSYGQNHLQRQIKNMALPDAIEVLATASDEEKKWLKPVMVQKINNWLKTASPEEMKTFIPKFQKAMTKK